jgi:hypothetical protein
MKLLEATQILDAQGREFSEIYKLYNFKDDTDLKDYLDFIAHEPVEWMKGFPARWVTKSSFGRPKTALVKLLKMEKIRQEYSEAYIQRIYDCVWSTFKKHADDLLAHRQKHQDAVGSVLSGSGDRTPTRGSSLVDFGSDTRNFIVHDHMDHDHTEMESERDIPQADIDSVHSVKIIKALAKSAVKSGACNGMDDEVWKRKYKILETAYRALLVHFGEKGLVASTSILLDALSGGDYDV